MSSRYAMILNGKVDNICLWDGDTKKWQPPEAYICIPAPDNIGIGWTYDGNTWAEPVIETPSE